MKELLFVSSIEARLMSEVGLDAVESPDTQASLQELLQLLRIRPTASSSAEQLRVWLCPVTLACSAQKMGP